MKGETHTQVVRLYISNVEARVWATHLFGGWLIPCLLLKFWSRDSKIVKTLCNAPINVKPVGSGGGRACGGDLTFFKNLQSNSLLTGKSFQSNATKFPHPALHIAVKYRKIPKIIPRAYIFQRPFLRGLYSEGLQDTEGNLRFKTDWASHVVGRKFTVFACFYFVFEGNFPSTSPRGAYIWRGNLTEGFLRYRFGGLIFRGAYFRNFTVS